MEVRMMKKVILLATWLLLLCCAPSITIEQSLRGEIYPPFKGDVRVIENMPEGKYLEIGELSALSQSETKSGLIGALKEKAASLGANAIIIVDIQESQKTVGVSTTDRVWWKPVLMRKITAIAILLE